MFACRRVLASQPWQVDPAQPLPEVHPRTRTGSRTALARWRHGIPADDW